MNLSAAVILLALAAQAADLSGIKSEPDANKRSGLALDNASIALQSARDAMRDGDNKKLEGALHEITESAELSYASLKQSGEKPHRSKYYKRAELKLRELIRMIKGFGEQLPMDQRETAVAVEGKLQEIHDQILSDALEKK
jgi:hypothetical protein